MNMPNIPQNVRQAIMSRLPDRFYHAAAFDGGCGEQGLAVCDYICAALMCRGGDRPCGNCAACRKVAKHEHPDIYILDNRDGKASVEQVRGIREQAYIAPGEADCRIFVIKYADKLSAACQNALLKILEEPPANVYFILLCENLRAMLQTVRSRTAAFWLGGDAEDRAGKYEFDQKTLAVAAGICTALSGGSELEIFEALKRIENLDSQQNRVIFDLLRVIIKNAALRRAGLEPEYGLLPEAEALLGNSFCRSELCRISDCAAELARRCDFHANASALIGTAAAMLAPLVKA